MAVDEISITGSYHGIREPGKPELGVTVPIILTPASDFDVKYLSNRVEIRRNPQLMRWADPTWDKPDLRWMTETKTNWVRLENQWREIGLIVEETTARIVWKGKTNVFTLETKEVGTTGPRDVNRTNVPGWWPLTWTNTITELIVEWPPRGGGK